MGTAWVARPWGNRAQPIADKLNAMIHSARTIVVFDEASLPAVKDVIATAREDLIRPPNLVVCDNYIGEKSVLLLKRELGLD